MSTHPFDPPQSEIGAPTIREGKLAEVLHGELKKGGPPVAAIGGCAVLLGALMTTFSVASVVLAVAEPSLIWTSLCYMVGGLFYGIPGALLLRSLFELRRSGSRREQVMAAVRSQRLFWQLTGLGLTLITLGYASLIVLLLVLQALGIPWD